MSTSKHLYTYLTGPADAKNANVDGSSTPVEFTFEPTAKCHISRVLVTVQDAGAFTATSYGAVAALANGVEFEHSGGTVVDLLGGLPITGNSDWARVCYDTLELDFTGGGSTSLVVRWTFAKAGIPLTLESGDSIIVRVNDNLTGLVGHYFMLQGYYT